MKSRDHSFDALKFVLICLVVLGHVIEKDKYVDPVKSQLFSFIYIFHMPLFIFISGYFSKNITWEKFKKSFKSLATTYVVFQVLYSMPRIFTDGFDIVRFLTVPCNVLWYIACLIIWRFVFVFISQSKIPFRIMMPASLAVAFGVGFGFVDGINDLLIRSITFFPFFVLGYYCASDIIKKVQNLNWMPVVLVLGLMFGFVYLMNDGWFILSLFISVPFKDFPDPNIAIIYRGIVYISAFIASVCVINLSMLTTNIFYRWGSKTLDVYLLHPYWLYYIYYELILKFLLKDESTWLIADVSVSIIIILMCLFFSRFKIMQALINPVGFFSKKEGLVHDKN